VYFRYRLGFEIINADAIQVYAGLPIATAKVSTEEMKGIPHHFLGVVKPPDTITVGQFQRQVHAKIEELFCKPECNGVIIVGGTTYYIEGLLFKNQLVGSLMEHQVGAGAGTERAPPSSSSRPCTIATEESSAELHERLAVLDPEAAAHLHPNNRRKVLRALQIIEEAGPKGLPPTLSALHALQSGLQSGECMGDGNPKDHTLHYPNSLVVHVSVEAADVALLESRISGRY
jgi:tRNA dimethylallyltransferase